MQRVKRLLDRGTQGRYYRTTKRALSKVRTIALAVVGPIRQIRSLVLPGGGSGGAGGRGALPQRRLGALVLAGTVEASVA